MSLFTKRHYIALAAALKSSADDDLSLSARARIINDVATMLEADSKGFDRTLFLDNCNAPEPRNRS